MPRATSHLRRVPDLAAPLSDRAPASRPKARAHDGSFSATVASIDGVTLEVTQRATQQGARHPARLAMIAGYAPTVGDRVMVARDGDELVVIAVLEAARPLGLAAPDGARVSLVDGAIELADAQGRLLVRYVDGCAEVAPLTGDLRLAAPQGRVRIEAGMDVSIEAKRDVTIGGDRTAEIFAGARGVDLPSSVRVEARGAMITGSHVDVTARATRVTTGEATLVAREARTSATRVETVATRVETTADQVVTRAKTLVQEVAGLLESKVGRARTIVKGAFSLRSKSTSMKSQEDTSVDGRRVLLG